MIQALRLDEQDFRGARFDAWNREVRGNNDLLVLTRPDSIRAIHLAYFRAGADIVSTNTFSSTTDRPGRLRHGGDRLRTELRRREAGQRSGQAGRGRGWQAALRRRRDRSDQSHSVDFAGRPQSKLPFRHVRRTAHRLYRAGARPARRRRRCLADRDHLRHAQRQGGDLRHRRRARRSWHRRADNDLRHDHRPLRAYPVRADAGSVLEFGRARRRRSRSD